ncbi:hypothetical protein Aph01nite_14090 [Acrocarpospora phusangensis]|uniref:Double-GTPase 2 domain-containing protein n=1 Tax=Acrocarpospora phusangensis TaxID=1070424 RepID=A0A919Q642_9ACTN|nr:ATP-binding protein [Acrocarpospora phusangensis]GIH23099.1 hypothetical protein Aph01nite_14090 [Acrocarpospora phusangensis]
MAKKNGSVTVRLIRCPICLDQFVWDEQDMYEMVNGQYQPLDLSRIGDRVKRNHLLRTAYKKCPNPSGDTDAHYMASTYGTDPNPLIIGLVGTYATGKTHLLAAIVGALVRGGLQPFGLNVSALDIGLHKRFLEGVRRLLEKGQVLPQTPPAVVGFADAFVIGSASAADARTRTVAFFDVAGEDLQKTEKGARFLMAADALIFVVDPVRATPALVPFGDAAGQAAQLGDDAFGVVLDQLRSERNLLSIPTTVAIAKADLLRFQPPVDRWWRSPVTPERFSAETIAAESRDAYAFLYQHGAEAWLGPFHASAHSTLHFVSATGTNPRGDQLPRGASPQRVLLPLLSILAMTGLLPGFERGDQGES